MSPINTFPTHLLLSDYSYILPDEMIARYPLERRDASKLLVWKNGQIAESSYADLAEWLPSPSLLVFNNSRVVEARILFQKPSGGHIEVFCLEPHPSYPDISKAMAEKGIVLWQCLIGGASKWKKGQVLEKKINDLSLKAKLVEKNKDDFSIEFSWTPVSYSFGEVLHQFGSIPLPPYLKRPAELSDTERYQTIYARESGSVAAPTAGLHFTEAVLNKLEEKKIDRLYTTLHVGAGTFMPVKSALIHEHNMHEEFIEIYPETIAHLISKLDEPVIAVGTTSLRTLETIYWLGLKVHMNPGISASDLRLEQYFPYEQSQILQPKEALNHLLDWTNRQEGKKLIAKTQLFIVPGYVFKIVRGLVTNFHQPQSTLLLLVAALVGPAWKTAYAHALKNNYRFLSYGDGCLFLPGTETEDHAG